MKLLGIGANKNATDTTVKFNKFYSAPTTPMPHLFSHLWDTNAGNASAVPNSNGNVTSFPSKRPQIEPDTIEIITRHNSHNKIKAMEERDEFDENEMMEMTAKFEKTNGLIRASKNQPQLMMARISTNIDTPPVRIRSLKNKKNSLQTPSNSRSGSRSPFSKKKSDKQISLLNEQNSISPETAELSHEKVTDLRYLHIFQIKKLNDFIFFFAQNKLRNNNRRHFGQ